MTLAFDEADLVGKLSRLPSRAKVAFATACATRQLRCYEVFAAAFKTASIDQMRIHVRSLWEAIEAGPVSAQNWQRCLDEVMSLAPEEDASWTPLHAYAEDAIASLSYSIRCLIVNSEQESAWAARRAYEASDQAAINVMKVDLGPGSEAKIRSHPIVQRELERQKRDVQHLQSGDLASAIVTIKAWAYKETLLDEGELQIPETYKGSG